MGTTISLIPSVIDIPEIIEDGFHLGQVYVGLKDSVWQPSSGLRHSAELYNTLRASVAEKTVLLLYTDGGTDHNVTFVANQLPIIALFLLLDLDKVIALRTAPDHSWKYPAEHVMSGINLGLHLYDASLWVVR